MAEFWEKDAVVAPSSSGDEFWKADPVAKAAAPVTADNLVRSAAHGIPILGGAMDNIAATMDAVTQPVLGRGSGAGTLSERRAANLKAEAAKSGAFAEQHPYVDTAAELTGGVGAFGAAAKLPGAARVLGLEGTLPQMVKAGALSNAAIGAADSAVRGTDPTQGAIVGGAVGAALPVVARGVGAAARGIKGAFTEAPVVPQRTVNVAGVDVPLTASQATGDAAMSAEEQLIRHGNRGDAAQTEAQRFAEDAAAKIKQAGDNIGAGLDPQSAIPRPPAEAAERVAAELADQANLAAAGQAENASASAMHRQAIDAQVNPQATGPVAPFNAAENVAAGVDTRAAAARSERTQAYRDYGNVPGEYEPAALSQIGTSIRNRISAGDNPVRVTEALTPNAHEALRVLDENIGSLRFQNDARTGEMVLDASGRPVPRPITGQTVEEARKELSALYGDARRASLGSGKGADVRAMDRIINAFDDHMGDVSRAGGFSGDAEALAAARDRARESHAFYRRTFSSRGPGDQVGANVEKILGRYEGAAATPEQVQQLSYGSASAPGGDMPTKVARRLEQILGSSSPEWRQYKQGMVSLLDDVGDGVRPRSHSERADRIERYLSGSHAQAVFSDTERNSLRGYAQQLRTMEPKPGDSIDKVIARIDGTDGNPALSAEETLNTILSSTIPGKKSSAFNLATRLKKTLSKDAWSGLRQAAWTRTIEAGEGKIPFGEQMLQKRISEMLNSGLSDVLFTKAEQHEMRKLADAYAKMVPVKGTTNPSGSAHLGAKIAKKAASNLFAMMGFAAHGPAGLLVGHGADKLAAARASRSGVKDARRLFYGNAPRAPLVTGNPLGGLLPGGIPAIEGQ